MEIRKGDIFWAELPDRNCKTNIQKGLRPVVVIQNNMGNLHSPTLNVVPLTSNLNKTNIPCHVFVSRECGIPTDSLALIEQNMPIDKSSLKSKIGSCTEEILSEIEEAILIQYGIDPDIHTRVSLRTRITNIRNSRMNVACAMTM